MGITISEHYCGNELVSVSINSEAEPCCDMDGCCHNENEHFQLQEDFLSPLDFVTIQIPEISVLFPLMEVVLNETTGEYVSFNEIPESPPPLIQTVLARLQTYLL